MSKNYIPLISDERLKVLCAKIKPLVRSNGPHKGGSLSHIEMPNPRNVSWIWDPKVTEQAKGIVPFAEITTYHTFGYYGFFKPSIAEVLAQIQDQYLEETVAFETFGPKTADDLNKQSTEINDGVHMARTVLYKKEISRLLPK